MKKKIKKTKKAKKANIPTLGELVGGDPDGGLAEMTNKKGPTVNYEAFVRKWKKAASVGEVAEAFDIKTQSASAIAARLRSSGIELKRFPRRGSQPIDVKALNRILAERD